MIPVAGPWITKDEIDTVTDAVTTDWYDSAGTYCKLFEESFADYIGVKHAVSLPHCTSAIHLSLLALNVGPGDEVVVPDVTWIASSAPISYVGADPVFADVDPVTWCISAQSFEKCISSKTKAIVAVDLYGGMPNMYAVLEIADKHNIPVVEDAAEAIGSEFNGRKAGSFGITGVFSFHGSKTLTTGEGGMLITNDTSLYERVLFLRDHGREPGNVSFNNKEIAYKYKMSSMQAALGYAQLKRINDLVAKKRKIFFWYKERLGDKAYLQLNAEPSGMTNSFWMTSIVVDASLNCPKLELKEKLSEKGIDSRPFFSPLSSLPAYKDFRSARTAREKNSISYKISRQAINLPSALNLTEDKVDFVCSELLSILEKL